MTFAGMNFAEMDVWDWVGLGSLLVGVLALLVGVARGQLKLGPLPIEERLARYPASARAVILRGRPIARWKLALFALVGLGLIYGVEVIKSHDALAWLCGHLGVTGTLNLLLSAIFPGLPVVLLLAMASAILESIRILRGGYAPPLDSKPMHDTIAVSGWRAQLKGLVVLIVMPVMACWCAFLAYDVRQSFEAGNKASQMALKCPGRPSSKSGTASDPATNPLPRLRCHPAHARRDLCHLRSRVDGRATCPAGQVQLPALPRTLRRRRASAVAAEGAVVATHDVSAAMPALRSLAAG